MATTPVSPGSPSNGADVTNGNTLDVLANATANTTTIESGGTETVETNGMDSAALVKAGGTQSVTGTTTGADVFGMQTINNGGTGGAEKIESGGTQTIAAGGSDTGATILTGGTQTVNGTASNDTVAGAVNLATAFGVVNNTTVNSGGSLNLLLKGTTANNTTVNQGGLLYIDGNAQANGVTLQGGTFELHSPKADTAATGNLAFAAGFNSKLQIDVPEPTVPAFSPTITGFAAGDVIDEQGLTFAGSSLTTSTSGTTTTVTVTGGNGTGAQSFSFANTPASSFALVSDGALGGTELIVCFAAGTRIRTAQGDVPVETLAVGDLAMTASGALRPIRWVGHRTIDCRTHPRRHDALPVRISAHAFGANRPARDLFVSPGHALCVDVAGEVLIPASALVNGATIAQVAVDMVTYWHVELDGGQDILLAENMPAESYVDVGNRDFFVENGTVVLGANPDAPLADHVAYCRPWHRDGAVVDAVRARLVARAIAAGWRREATMFAGLHLMADGIRIEPTIEGFAARFLVSAEAGDVRLLSAAATPAETSGSPDPRRLGVCLATLAVDDGLATARMIALDDLRLSVGFHAPEITGTGIHRWTDGDARLPAAFWNDCRDAFFLRLTVTGPALPHWIAPAMTAAAMDAALKSA